MSAHSITLSRRIWDLSPEARDLKKLIDKSRYYPTIFHNAIDKVPSTFSKFLRALHMKKAAEKLEVSRANKMIDDIEYSERDAQKTIAAVHELATKNHKRATSEYRKAVGEITTLRNKLELCIKAREHAFEECRATIAFVSEHININLPTNHLDWADVQFGIYPGDAISIEERVFHQERWNYVVEKINLENETLTELKISESTLRDSSLIQALCQHLISSARQEEKLLTNRFRMLKNTLAMGELTKLPGFFELRINGGTSLKQFNDDIDELEKRFLLEAHTEDLQ